MTLVRPTAGAKPFQVPEEWVEFPIHASGRLGYTPLAMDGYDRPGHWAKPVYDLDLAIGQLTREGRPVPLSDRDLKIIASLAIHGEPLLPAELGAMVLPGIEERVAVNALKVSIHRLRARVGDVEIVQYSYARGGYLFGSTMRVNHTAKQQAQPQP
jgi:DNA-binding winged helix-turn-helix (wHTH) protein